MNRARIVSVQAIWTAWLLLAVLACVDAGETSIGPVVRDSAGVKIVENDHTRPRWATPWVLSEEPVLRIGSAEGDTTQLLYQVSDTRRLRDGRILVANSGSAEVRIYGADGQLLQTLGRRGEGPGEFSAPWHAYPIRGDSILVVDLYQEVAIFDSNGVYAREFSLSMPGDVSSGLLGGESAEPVDQFGDGSLLFRGHYAEDPSRAGVRRNVVRMLRSNLEGSLASLGDYDDQTVNYGPPAGGEYAFGAWAKEAASESTMWYGPGDRLELREVAFDGTLLRLVRLDRPARPVTESDRVQYRRDYAEQMATWNPGRGDEVWRRRAEETLFPGSFPAHLEIEADARGNVWVQDYRSWISEDRVDREWSVFDPEGVYLGVVVIPGGLAVHDIGEDHVIGKWTDDLGVEYVHLYRIEKPSG